SPVPPNDRAASCLSDSDLRRLHALGRQVSAYYNAPQDIEWGICGDELYLLQTRPITSLSNLSNTDSGHGPA
ncbi:PEP/pyruvate-binding domain-containing protein, partial [Rothia sp. HMSC071F11]